MSKSAKKKKSPKKTPEVDAGQLVVPAHGRGRIMRGSKPGHRGGTGRPPNALREEFRGVLGAGGLDFIRSVIDGNTTVALTGVCEHCGMPSKGPQKLDELMAVVPSVDNRLRAVDTAAKYGLGALKEVSVENVRERLLSTLAIIRKQLPQEKAEAIIAHLRDVWA